MFELNQVSTFYQNDKKNKKNIKYICYVTHSDCRSLMTKILIVSCLLYISHIKSVFLIISILTFVDNEISIHGVS